VTVAGREIAGNKNHFRKEENNIFVANTGNHNCKVSGIV
jgi:hypothetical protein